MKKQQQLQPPPCDGSDNPMMTKTTMGGKGKGKVATADGSFGVVVVVAGFLTILHCIICLYIL
jgi:hypothetical protein